MQQYFQDRLLPFCFFRVQTIRMNFVFDKSPSLLGEGGGGGGEGGTEMLEDSLVPVCSLTLNVKVKWFLVI